MIQRLFSTDRSGNSYLQSTIDAVWEKGSTDQRYDPSIWRYDSCGHWMKKSDYGNVKSQYGWEIDHITPVANDGSDNLVNLQPLQWANNRRKGDGVLVCR